MSSSARLLVLLAALAAAAAGWEREPWSAFEQRRRSLMAERSGSFALLFGYEENEAPYGPGPLRQESNFYYLTGCLEPGAALLLEQPGDGRQYRETLFLPARNPNRERWTGPRIDPSARDADERTGVAEVAPLSRLEAAVRKAADRRLRGYGLLPQSAPDSEGGRTPGRFSLWSDWGLAQPSDIRPEIETMRRIKSPGELALIEKAVEASARAHIEAWRGVRAGLYEHQVAARFAATLLDRGALRFAYPPIIGSGRNATILHYSRLEAALEPGDLLLADVAGEYARYTADLTRTIPVSGRFTDRQREIYEAVLGAQDAMLELCGPGAALDGPGERSLTAAAHRYLERRRRGWSKMLPHSGGHHVGLDVHDPGELSDRLEPGMVITLEPGLYFADEGLGVRIEDMAVVTDDGCRILSRQLPRRIADIERGLETALPQESAGVRNFDSRSRIR